MKVLKRRRLFARIAVLAMALMMVLSMSLTVYAVIETDTTKQDNFAKQNGYNDFADMTTNIEDVVDTRKGVDSTKATNDTKNTYYEINGLYYKSGDVAAASTNAKVGELEVNVAADVGAANELVSGFEPVIQLIIGILAWAIVIGLPLITALDVAYITIPFFREKTEDMKAKGGPMVTQGKNGESKVRWISDEAQHAVATLDLENGRSPLKTYLTSRIGAFIMVAIILYLLIGGQITVVTQLAVRLVSGIMNILSGLAR